MDSKDKFRTLVALVRALESNVRAFRNAVTGVEKKCCLKRIRRIEARLGTDVVQAVSIAVARDLDVVFEIFEALCANKRIGLPTRWVQHMLMSNGIGVCPVCGAIVLRDDTNRGRPDLAMAVAT